MYERDEQVAVSRRAVLRGGVLILLTGPMGCAWQGSKRKSEPGTGDAMLTIGLLTDVHYADKEAAGSRHYRQGLARVQHAVKAFNAAEADFAVELGDLVDRADVELEIGFLRKIDTAYAGFQGPRHYVLGNHCVDTLTKDEFVEHSGMPSPTPHYSFDAGDYHFAILDACYRADGIAYGRRNFDWKDCAIPPTELDWLRADLAAAKGRPTIVFVHQRLDLEGPHGVTNQVAVREVLQKSGQVRAVFQGHNHINDLQEIGGIFYVTLAAVVEGGAAQDNAYSILRLEPNGVMRIEGFANQSDWLLG